MAQRAGTTTNPVLQMKTLRPREIRVTREAEVEPGLTYSRALPHSFALELGRPGEGSWPCALSQSCHLWEITIRKDI